MAPNSTAPGPNRIAQLCKAGILLIVAIEAAEEAQTALRRLTSKRRLWVSSYEHRDRRQLHVSEVSALLGFLDRGRKHT